MDFLLLVTFTAAVVGLVVGVLQLTQHLRKLRSAKDVLRIVPQVHYDYDHVVFHYDRGVPREVNLRRENASSVSVDIELDIVSLADDEEVKLPPFILVNQLSAEKLKPEAVGFEVLERGGGGSNRLFMVALSPTRSSVFRAPIADVKQREVEFENAFDFFRLSKGEREVFELYVMQVPGYRYQFRVGIPYVYKRKTGVRWLPEEFHLAMIDGPTKVFEWWENGDVSIKEVHREMSQHLPRDWVVDALKRGEEALAPVHGFEEYWSGKDRTGRA